MTPAAPRDRATRVADTRRRLDADTDAWLASGNAEGPWLVPLTFWWDGDVLRFATELSSATCQRLEAQQRVRVALGETRDVVMIDGEAEVARLATVPAAIRDGLAARLGSDVGSWADAVITIRPERVQAWREENELVGRVIMRDGRWLA